MARSIAANWGEIQATDIKSSKEFQHYEEKGQIILSCDPMVTLGHWLWIFHDPLIFPPSMSYLLGFSYGIPFSVSNV